MPKISDCLKAERESPDHVIRLVRNNNFLRAYNRSAWLFPFLGVLSHYDSYFLRRLLFTRHLLLKKCGNFNPPTLKFARKVRWIR